MLSAHIFSKKVSVTINVRWEDEDSDTDAVLGEFIV